MRLRITSGELKGRFINVPKSDLTVASGFVWFGERMSQPEMIGSILVLMGVILATQYDVVKMKIVNRKTS